MRQTMAAAFVSCKTALDNCAADGNTEWEARWRVRLGKLVELIPSGIGIDRGPRSYAHVEVKPDAIRFEVSFHHMDGVGFYAGWTDHAVTIRPAFDGVDVRVSGRPRNGVKEYIREAMDDAFSQRVEWDEPAQRWIVTDPDVGGEP